MADPPGETFVEDYKNYGTTRRNTTTVGAARNNIHPNPHRRDAPPSTLIEPVRRSTTASVLSTSGTEVGPYPTFKDQVGEVDNERRTANPYREVHRHAATISSLTSQSSGKNTSTTTQDETITVVEATLSEEVPSIFLQVEPGFPPTPFATRFQDDAFLTELKNLQKEIKELETLSDCRDMYRNRSFMDCLTLIRSAQNEFMEANNTSTTTPRDARILWSQKWSTAKNLPRTAQTEWAWILDECRKTTLGLVYRMCNLANNEQEGLGILQDDDNYLIVVDTIVSLCLVMDRANCLYHMRHDASGTTGLCWYRKDVEETLPERYKNPTGSLMNKRLSWVFDQVLKQSTTKMLAPLMQVALPPRLKPKEP